MTIAEIHGKLRPYESMEDLLTSDVFGTFQYCNLHEGLIPFLEQAVPFDGSKADLAFLKDVESAKYFFWPRSNKGREPDLIIILKSQNGKNVALNIEAKYFSGKHNIDVDTSEDPDDKPIDESPPKVYFSGDQLVDQYIHLKARAYCDGPLRKGISKALQSVTDVYLFYITAHYLLPGEDVDETKEKAKIKNFTAINKFFWLNWAQAWKVCCSGEKNKSSNSSMFHDLRLLLERKRLIELSLWGDSIKISNLLSPFFWSEKKIFWQGETRLQHDHYRNFFWNSEVI